MIHPLLEPEISDTGTAGRWMVTLYNNDVNSFEEVIAILVEATACDLNEASIEAWEAHTYGKAPVHFATKEDCDEVAVILGRIGLKTDVTPEWGE